MIWRWGYVFQALSWSVAGLLVDGFSWCCIFLVGFCWNSEQMVFVSSFSKGTCKEVVAAVYANLPAPAVTWFHLFLEEKDPGQADVILCFHLQILPEPHHHLQGNRNKDMAHSSLYLFHYFWAGWKVSAVTCTWGLAKWVRIKHRFQICMLDFAHLGKSSCMVVIVS